MRYTTRLACAAGLLLGAASLASADALAITGGKVFDGEKFVARDLFVQDDVFVAARPEKIDRTIDATGLFLLPPFAEAHTHSFFGGPQSRGANMSYLRTGVFYALSANNTSEISQEWRKLGDDDLGGVRVDVLWANGGLTAPEGHPVDLYRTIHTRFMGQPAETFLETMDDSAFYQVESAEALDKKFEKLLASQPDLIKLYLLGHDVGGQKFNIGGEEKVYQGLSEETFREAVKRAHAAGKRCIVHVETASDVALAVDAGADGLAHLPYAMQGDDVFESKGVSGEMAALITKQKMAVIATSGIGRTLMSAEKDEARRAKAQEVWEGNLRVLKEAGALVLVGSDQFTPIGEANSLEKSGVFTRAEILKMWVEQTPQWMYPDRKIGALEEGFEASVIGLAADPLEEWGAIQQVKLAVKQGKVVSGNVTKPGGELME